MKRYITILLVLMSIISLSIGIGDIDNDVFLHSRVPRLVALLLSGAGLALAGTIMQQLSRNRFSSPSIMGVNDCTMLGLCIALLFFSSSDLWICVFIGFAFAVIGMLLVTKILDVVVIKDPLFIPLIGIMFGKVIQAVYMYIGYKYNLLQDLQTWMLGDFSTMATGRYELLYLVIPVIGLAYLYSMQLTMIGLGQGMVSNMGIDYDKIKYIGIMIVSTISAVTILICGHLPFIGLIVPNLVNIMHGANIRKNMFYILSYGALITVVCDTVGRYVKYPFEIPISLILGILGSIVFIFLILRGDRCERQN